MFTWQFNTKKDKGAGWYTIAIIISIALIIWGFFSGLYIMSIVILLVIGVYTLVENNSPDTLIFEINENGVLIGEEFYDYPKLETFSIIYSKNIPSLLRFKLKGRGFKVMDIPLIGPYNSADLRQFLAQYIVEDEKGEISSLESITNYLKL